MKFKKKILTIDKYIDEALYNKKHGYYMKKNPFGKNGDYITAPNISILFSEMIAIWIIAFWENLKCPKKFNLVELGAGNGEMMKQIINTFNRFPIFNKSCKIYILEKSIYLKKIQKLKLKSRNIKWLNNLKEIGKGPNIFIANEFFDSLPIKQYLRKNGRWYERNIIFSDFKKPKFVDLLINIKKIEKKIGIKLSYKQNFIEYSPAGINYLKIISKKINYNGGGILIIDYGSYDKNMKNTLQSVSGHKYNCVLNDISNSDITHSLNFKTIEKIVQKFKLRVCGFTNQKNFLKNLGIFERAEIISKNLPFSKKADIYYRIKRLTDENAMGGLFKVMLLTKKNAKFQIGFKN